MPNLNTVHHGCRVALAAALVVGIFLGNDGPGFAQTAKPPAAPGPRLDGPLSPENAPRSFQLEPGLRLELVAAEPLVVSPVAVAFDERGRMFVAENRGYPTGPGPGKPPVGRIVRLDDTDGDGRIDRRTEFADGLTFPNGLMPWKGGLIVTCAPDVFFLRDTNGDGKADEKRVLFTGFDTNRSTQLRVSHPLLSRDNWVYLTSGLSGGKVSSPAHPDRPAVTLNRADFRFRPDGDAYEATDGGAQFGETFDDFNRRFICYNRVQVQHVVLDSKTLRRNPNLAFSATVQNCPAETVAEPLKGHGAAARLFPISSNITTADSHAGTFTAACSVFVYRGIGLSEHYRNGAFSCDPTGNLVHFDRLEPKGATFAALPGQHGKEFLASSDNWFRPVFLAAGPEGGLYICDMYRKTIEHPDYLSPEIRKRTDFESGKTMGRIWRVVRNDFAVEGRQGGTAHRLRRGIQTEVSTVTLAGSLRSPDGWWRDTAQRLLIERHDPAAIEPLRRSLAAAQQDLPADNQAPPATVVQALYLLERFDALPDELLRTALKHRAAPVRENALVLVRGRIAHAPSWLEPALELADDPDARVRFEAAITLGDVTANGGKNGAAGQGSEPSQADTSIAAALARVAVRDGADRWARAAVFSSLAGRELPFLTALRDAPRPTDALPPELLNELGRLLGASRPRAEWPELVGRIVDERKGFTPEEQAGLLTGLAEAARSRIGPAGARDVLAAIIEGNGALETPVRSLVERMKTTAAQANEPLPRRETAVGLLALAGFGQTGETLLRLVDSDPSPELRAAAVRALGSQRDDRVADALLKPERFANYPPRLRDEVLSAVVSQSQHVPGLLAAIEQGSVPAAAVDALRRRQLSQSRDPEIRSRAQKLFGTVSGDRAKVYEAYKGVVDLKSDPARNGRAVFRRECASCHRLDREGFAVGPDLFGMRNQPKETILLHILVPDHEITQGFAAYTVATKDGRVLTGLITGETPTSLTLRQPLGKEDAILRSEIEELSASKQSLMPQGLEKNISRQDFADLLAYLKGEGYSSEGSAP